MEKTVKERVRLSFDVTSDVYDRIEALADKLGGTRSDAIRKGIALLEVCVHAKDRGLKPALVPLDQVVTTELYGI